VAAQTFNLCPDNGNVPHRLWLWPNLLSLDAPVVALLWQVFFVRCFRVHLDPLAAGLLALAVWLIYVADRLLDAWRGAACQARHAFYRRHWRALLPVWTAALLFGAWLAVTQLPRAILLRGAALAACVLAYLATVHATPAFSRRDGSKEAAVAMLFALGASLAAWPAVRSAADVLAIVLFSLLCWMNCAAIEDWERGRRARLSVVVAAGVVGAAAALLLREQRPILGCAETAAALGLMLLDRARLSRDALRVLADAALLTPLLLLPAVA
jgi:hypothetical protein